MTSTAKLFLRRSAIWVSLLLTISAAHSQGTLLFANLATGVNAPVTNSATGSGVGPQFVADLYFSTITNAPSETFIPAHFNQPFSTVNGGAYFLGGTKTNSNVPGGTFILAQVRVWDSQFGSTYEQALASGGSVGFSQPALLIQLGTPPAVAPALVGLQGFQVSSSVPLWPSITLQPLTQNAAAGGTASLYISATQPPDAARVGSIRYQWYFNETTLLVGQTNPVLKLVNVQAAQSGGYHAVARNLFGSVRSQTALFGVITNALQAPTIPALLISNTAGTRVTLQDAANLNPPILWQLLAVVDLTNDQQLFFDVSAPPTARFYQAIQVR